MLSPCTCKKSVAIFFLRTVYIQGYWKFLVGKVLVIFIVMFKELIVSSTCSFLHIMSSCCSDHLWIPVINLRFKHIRGSCCLHSAPVWKPQQEKRHKRDLHPLHLCHRHKQHPVCVWCCHRCHYQEQPQGLWTVLNFTILCKQ